MAPSGAQGALQNKPVPKKESRYNNTNVNTVLKKVNTILKTEDVNFVCGIFYENAPSDQKPELGELQHLMDLHNRYLYHKEANSPNLPKALTHMAELYLTNCLIHLRMAYGLLLPDKDNTNDQKPLLEDIHLLLMKEFQRQTDPEITETNEEEDEGKLKGLRELFVMIMEIVASSRKKKKENPKEDVVKFLPDLRSVYILLGLYTVFGKKCVIDAFKKTVEESAKDSKIKKDSTEWGRILGLLQHFCTVTHESLKQQTSNSTPVSSSGSSTELHTTGTGTGESPRPASMDPEFIRRMLRSFLTSYGCILPSFQQFFMDSRKLNKENSFSQVKWGDAQKTPTDCIIEYSKLLYKYLTKKLEKIPTNITQPWKNIEKTLNEVVFPVILRNGCYPLDLLEEKVTANSPTDLIDYITEEYINPRTLSETRQKWNNTQMKIDAFVKTNTQNAVGQWLEKRFGKSSTTVACISRQKLFEELESMKLDEYLGKKEPAKSEIQTANCLETTALEMAIFLLENMGTTAGNVELILVNHNNQINASTTTIPVCGIADKSPPNCSFIRCAKLSDVKSMDIPDEYTSKNKTKRFAILAGVDKQQFLRSTPVALTPLLLIAWVHAMIHLDNHPTLTVNDCEDKVLVTLKYWLEKDVAERQFGEDRLKEHVHIAVSLARNNGKFELDRQLQNNKDAASTMSKTFGSHWIHLKHFAEYRDVTPESAKVKRKKDKVKRSWNYNLDLISEQRTIELNSIFADIEETWIASVKHEISVNKERGAVIVTTTPANRIRLETELKNELNKICGNGDTNVDNGDVLLVPFDYNAFILPLNASTNIHVISCELPRHSEDHAKLSGKTFCLDKVFTYRFILCKSLFSYEAQHTLQRNKWDNLFWKEQPKDSPSTSLCQTKANLWKMHKKAEEILNRLPFKNDSFEKRFDHFYKELKYEKVQDLRLAVSQVGDRIVQTDDYLGLITYRLLTAARKHFANVEVFADIMKPAGLAKIYRGSKNTLVETVVHFPGDPDDFDKSNEKRVYFHNRSGFQLAFDREDELKEIKILRGAFAYDRNPNSSNVLTHLASQTSNGEIIYEKYDNNENVIEYIKRRITQAESLKAFLDHHMQVLNIISPGDSPFTTPTTEIVLSTPLNKWSRNFPALIENKTTQTLEFRVGFTGTNMSDFHFKQDQRYRYFHLMQDQRYRYFKLNPQKETTIIGTYSGIAPNIWEINCSLEIKWATVVNNNKVDKSVFEKDHCLSKSLPIRFNV